MRARVRALQGFLLAMGAPIGWLLIRMWQGVAPWVEVAAHPGLYLYLLMGTGVALAAFGYVLGEKEDRLQDLNRHLDEIAITDSLTGLRNRRFFLARLAERCEQLKRTGRPFSLVILDLDHFKTVNDTKGHLVGDQVLVRFAEILGSSMRRSELAARVGGEEFALLLPDSDIEEACLAAERLRREVQRSAAGAAGLPEGWEITVSAGVASSEGWGRDMEPSQLFAAADKALYRAKDQGRNRVAVSSGPGQLGLDSGELKLPETVPLAPVRRLVPRGPAS